MKLEWNKVTWYSKLIALVVFVLLPIWGFMLGAWYQAVFDQQGAAMGAENTGTDSYAPNTWKVWRDGEFLKNSNTYLGYTLSYPRDFDVYQGDQASGGYTGQAHVKIDFPQDAFLVPKTNFGGAFVTVSVGSDASSVKNCYTNIGPTGKQTVMADTTVINGITFYKGNAEDVGAGNIYTTELYRTLRDNRCYELALTVHTGNIANYPAGTVTEFNKENAYAILRNILSTFNFTDKAPQ